MPSSLDHTPPTDSRETEQRLLDVAIRHLELYGWDGAQLQAIVAEVPVAKSSVYHFFGNREGLLAAATAERYRRSILTEDVRNIDDARLCQTEQEFLQFISSQLVRIATHPDTISARRDRVLIAADALRHDELATDIAKAQQALVDAVAEMIGEAQSRGLANPDVDPVAYASWFHGMALGRTLVESTCRDPQRWLDVAIPAALAPLRSTS